MSAHTSLMVLGPDEADTMLSPERGDHATVTPPHTNQDQAMTALSHLVDEVLIGDVARLTRTLRVCYQVA
jgi:hypothetical protein